MRERRAVFAGRFACRADRELAAKRADDFKARGEEKTHAQLNQHEQDLAAARPGARRRRTEAHRGCAEAGKAKAIAATEAQAKEQLERARRGEAAR